MASEAGFKILPQVGKDNRLITSALPYVNNVPHLGNIVGSVLSADVFSRYCKARGYPTLFICGTDEYGTATETKAIEEKLTPQQLCDKYHALHAQVYKWFNIGFDHFGRTPTQQQTDIAQDIFTKLLNHGYLEEKTTIQPYCETHSSFLADRFVEGECPNCAYVDARGDQCDKCGKLLDPLELINPRCKLDGASPKPRETKHIYMLLDKLQPDAEKWFKEASVKGSWSSNGINITQSWLNEGLKPRGITRDLKWGTAVPLEGYEDKVLYVWFDACIGYVSITATYTEEWEKWWRNPDVSLYQFMGKDNVPFHSVIFPSSQIGTKDVWTKLHHLATTEYLNYEGGKFSKSRNIGVFGTNAEQTGISSDVFRYYLLRNRPETSDSEFEWKAFIDANNNELLKNFGNFINRILVFVSKIYDSALPDFTAISSAGAKTAKEDIDKLDAWKAEANTLLKTYTTNMEAVKLRAGLASALHLSSHGNLLLQSNKLDKALATNEPERCAAVAGLAVNLCHLLASVIEPYMPLTSQSVLEQLNASLLIIPETWTADSIPPGHKLGQPKHLFGLIPTSKEAEWRDMFGGEEALKAKREKAEQVAAKKAQKEAEKLRKKLKKTQIAPGTDDPTVEAGPKEDAAILDTADGSVDEVTDGVHQAVLHPS